MKITDISFKLGLNELKEAMRLVPKLWFLCAMVGGLAVASTVLGETGPLTIEKIGCDGNRKTSCEYIANQTSLREGEKLEDEKVKEAKLRLQLLGHFDDVEVRLAKGSEVGKVRVTIWVSEHSSYTLNASIGVAEPQHPFYGIADATVADRNLTGRGDSLSLRGRSNYQDQSLVYKYTGETLKNIEHFGRLEYIRPGLVFPRLYLVSGLGVGQWRDHYVGVTNGWADTALGYKIFDYSFVAAGYRHFFNGAHANGFFQYGWDSQDNANFPTQGSRFLADFHHNSGVFFRDYYKDNHSLDFSISYLKHWEVADGHVLSLRLGEFHGTDPAFTMREDMAVSLRYTNHFKRHSMGSGIQNATFYVEPGQFSTVHHHDWYQDFGVRLGTTFQTKYGVFNLFAIVSGIK